MGFDGPPEATSGSPASSSSRTPWGSTCTYGRTAPVRPIVTNLRLPGQYDERLFAAAGLSGLQGPYYNWNRWYLPGLGRYLELDPVALDGEFSGPLGPEWYAYAGDNPLRFVDPAGLRITSGVTQGPDQFGVVSCADAGKAGGACLRIPKYTTTACKCSCGKCKFDANVKARVWRQFLNHQVMNGPSADSPGLTLAQHENLHISDYKRAFGGNALDALYQTEDFTATSECDAKRQGFGAWLDSYADGVVGASGRQHDAP
jgi:RHS repeat-associated protein